MISSEAAFSAVNETADNFPSVPNHLCLLAVHEAIGQFTPATMFAAAESDVVRERTLREIRKTVTRAVRQQAPGFVFNPLLWFQIARMVYFVVSLIWEHMHKRA